MDVGIKCKIFPEDSKEFPWDEEALKTFKRKIKDIGIKCRMDDIFLLGFLRARKFDQERSIQLLKNYYSRRGDYYDYFKELWPSKLEHALSSNFLYFLRKPDQHGRYIFIMQIGNWDPNVVTAIEYLQAVLLHFDFQLNFHRTQVNSIVFILNATGTTLRQLFECTPRYFYTVATLIFKDAYQLRIKEMHYANVNIILKGMLSFLIPFLPAKLKNRIHFHSGTDTLHQFVHPQYLPEDLGGELPKFDPTETIQMMKDNEEFFRMNGKYIKIFEEGTKRNFTEGRFRYLEQNDALKEIIENSDEKYKKLTEDPESFLSEIEKNPGFEVTHL